MIEEIVHPTIYSFLPHLEKDSLRPAFRLGHGTPNGTAQEQPRKNNRVADAVDNVVLAQPRWYWPCRPSSAATRRT